MKQRRLILIRDQQCVTVALHTGYEHHLTWHPACSRHYQYEQQCYVQKWSDRQRQIVLLLKFKNIEERKTSPSTLIFNINCYNLVQLCYSRMWLAEAKQPYCVCGTFQNKAVPHIRLSGLWSRCATMEALHGVTSDLIWLWTTKHWQNSN